ncbi:MAG: protein-disulfide reductase DsbD domain-containing protein [Luteolibacter sp.]
MIALISAVALLTSLCAMAEAPKRSGKATAQWIAPAGPVEAGQSLKTVIRIDVDDPWHVYWYNPGEAGMPTSAEIKLPEGWKSSGLLHPIPKNFKTGGLHGFGHEGIVDYALELIAPKGFKGDAEFEANVEWLSCNDDACIPGEMMLKLKLVDGKPVGAATNGKAVSIAFSKLPIRADTEVMLTLESSEDDWKLVIEDAAKLGFEPANTEVFIETQELVHASTKVTFKKVQDKWVAEAPKSEFALQKPDECAIVLVQKGKPAVRLEWKRP